MNARTETAAQSYARNMADIRNLIDHLEQQMTMHEEYTASCIDWGHVGTAAKWRGQLIELVMDVMGSPDDDATKTFIKEALADAHTKGA